MITVLVLEDDIVVREEIAARINSESGFSVVASVGDLAAARSALLATQPAIALLDLHVPDGNAVTLIPAARAARAEVLVLTVSEARDDVYRALAAGAGGYLLKADALGTVGEALRVLTGGGAPISPRIARRLLDHFRQVRDLPVPTPAAPAALSPREQEIVELFSSGATYSEVGSALGMSVNTVRQHVRNLYDKLHVSSKTEAVMRVIGRPHRSET